MLVYILLETLHQNRKAMDTVNIDFLGPSQISSIPYFLIQQFSLIHDQSFMKYGFWTIL